MVVLEARHGPLLSLVVIGILHVSSKCTNYEMCVYVNASLENTQIQSVTAESVFPKSCAAACADRKSCLGVTDDKKTKRCNYHFVDDDGGDLYFNSMKPGQTLFLEKKYNGECLSVSLYAYIWIYTYIRQLDNEIESVSHWMICLTCSNAYFDIHVGIFTFAFRSNAWKILKMVRIGLVVSAHETIHGPLTRNVTLRVAHAPGMPGTFSLSLRVSDLDIHHDARAVMHVGIANQRFPLKSVARKTFPTFPAHAQPALLRIW